MHRIRRAAVTLALLSSAPAPLCAQSVLETVWGDVKTVPGDLLHVWTAPARIGADDVPALVLFAGATTLVAVNDLAIQEWVRAHPRSVPLLALEPFRHEHDALSRIGQNHWMLRGAAVGYVVGLASDQEWLREAALGCAVGNTSNALPRKAVYSLIARRRPSGHDDPYDFDVPGGDWAVHSFFGGHAANAFTCASFLAHRWELGWGEPVLWLVATGVATARTADEAHWASDTLVGSAFGFMAGRMIAQRYRARAGGRADGPDGAAEGAMRAGGRVRVERLTVVPLRTSAGTGVLLGTQISF